MTIFLLLLLVLLIAGACGRARAIAFQLMLCAAGGLVLAAALLSPLHELADRYISAHMLQHELLMVLAAPLLALARTQVLLLSSLPQRARRFAACAIGRLRMGMAAAWVLHSSALWLWHVPSFYDAAVQRPVFHAAQHLSFFGTALLFWSAVFQRRSGYGAAALYVFLTSMHSGVLGALLFLSPRLWYRSYAAQPGALEDQQLAGLIMWIPGGLILALTALLLLWRWLHHMEQRVAAGERLSPLGASAHRLGLLVTLASGLGAALVLTACNDPKAAAISLTGGNPDKGRAAIRNYGCATCHTIPGIAAANGVVGPPLTGVANRAYVAGHPNSAEQLISWIRDPQKVRSPTPMPNMGVSESDARDIAAYLYTLR
jgi:putative membrane protein